MATDTLQFRSWGFELFVPPTPLASERARFVMLDDLNDVFYDVDYGIPLLGNKIAWQDLALHKVPHPAIVFPPEQQDMFHQESPAIAFLVSIESRTESSLIIARKLGYVNIKPIPKLYMNWSGLRGKKGSELPAEMRAGLLRRVWNRHDSHADGFDGGLVTSSSVLDAMSRKWHLDGVALNYELDENFVGGKALGPPSLWRVSKLDQQQIEKSKTRAAMFIEEDWMTVVP